jgi:hypothetical protein
VAADSGEPQKTRHAFPDLERAAPLKELRALIVRVRDGDEEAVPGCGRSFVRRQGWHADS